MEITITIGNETMKLATTRMPHRKKPVLCKVENGNQYSVIAHFLDDASREEFDKFMEFVAKLKEEK